MLSEEPPPAILQLPDSTNVSLTPVNNFNEKIQISSLPIVLEDQHNDDEDDSHVPLLNAATNPGSSTSHSFGDIKSYHFILETKRLTRKYYIQLAVFTFCLLTMILSVMMICFYPGVLVQPSIGRSYPPAFLSPLFSLAMILAALSCFVMFFFIFLTVNEHRLMNTLFDDECLLSYVYYNEEEARLAMDANVLFKAKSAPGCWCLFSDKMFVSMETNFEGMPPMINLSKRGIYISSQLILAWGEVNQFVQASLVEKFDNKFIKISYTYQVLGLHMEPRQADVYLLVPNLSIKLGEEGEISERFHEDLYDPNPQKQAAKVVRFLNTNTEWRTHTVLVGFFVAIFAFIRKMRRSCCS